MAVLGKSELLKLIKDFNVIYPYNPQLLDGDSYLLTVKERRTLSYLRHENLLSREIVFTPPNYVAHLTAKSKYGRMGLSFLNSAKVHSGFVGRLILELVNFSNNNQPIAIQKGDPLVHIEFMSRIGDPSPYIGPFQFQYMTNSEVEKFLEIASKIFGKDDMEVLRKQARTRI
jgi:dCTP deaminase